MRELEFIRYITRKFKTKSPVVFGIGDDCAVIKHTKDKFLLLTCDMIVERTHFTSKTRAFEIGWKAMAVNISDIASMGGIPKYALVAAAVPRGKNVRFLKEIIRGVEKISKKFNISIIGGDTNSSERIVLSVTLIGEAEKKYLTKRDGAKPGDLIFVTGALGEGKSKHLNFLPRLSESRKLVKNFKINSMIDLSDGLAMDLNRLAVASNVGACVYKSLIPLSKKSEPLEKSIFAGEDFELLFTASIAESRKIIKRMGEKDSLPITLIGEIVKKPLGVGLIGDNGKLTPLKPKGYAHF
ncbi:MAG: thiamine-monophosphate kinase [Candidatus Omnitrophica bacterium]|nr:thiamine-monophosphate kinase [Candidatus Omnitrophota bacterium]